METQHSGLREVVFDVETTGLDPKQGDRLIEIGCIELIDGQITGNFFHSYVNPGRKVSLDAYRIHGISDDLLATKDPFSHIAEDLLGFLQNSSLIAHNGKFDMKFVNHELSLVGKEILSMGRLIDTLTMARRIFPGSPTSLDALCRKLNVDLSQRNKHGALLDAQLLALVYIQLRKRKKQAKLSLMGTEDHVPSVDVAKPKLEPRPHQPNHEELEAHQAFIKRLKEPLWQGQ